MTRDDLTAAVQDMRAELRNVLRSAHRPNPDWEGAAKALDKVNELSCELWRVCLSESWKFEERGEAS